MKKGQMLSQPFTYIFALVVMAMIVSTGFYLVFRTKNLAESVDTAKFKSNLEDKVNEIASLSTGSGDELNLAAPSGVRGICFINLKTGVDTSKIKYSDVSEDINLYKDAEKLDLNVFFASKIGDKTKIKPIAISKLRPNVNPLCFDFTSGVLKVSLENKGSFVEVSH